MTGPDDDYGHDVAYEVWRRGGNPDRVDFDRTSDDYWNDIPVGESAEQFLPKPEPEEPEP